MGDQKLDLHLYLSMDGSVLQLQLKTFLDALIPVLKL